jgi:hypothetical protein
MLFKLVSEYGSLVALVDSGTQESHREDATVYPGFGPYVQHLMILMCNSTQNLEGLTKCKRKKRFGRG